MQNKIENKACMAEEAVSNFSHTGFFFAMTTISHEKSHNGRKRIDFALSDKIEAAFSHF